MDIAENIARIRAEMEQAAAGRPVQLLAATKTRTAAEVQQAIAAGVDICGENRVQELVEKSAQHAYDGAPVHFIGQLQKNKVKFVVGAVSLIHSVDSPELLACIDRHACALGLRQDVLLEVNIGREASKGGVLPEALEPLLAQAGSMQGIHVRGLMAIPPAAALCGGNRVYFARMYQLFVDIGRKKYDNVNMDILSMGMSDDFREAIAEGSNMIRIGSGIFGRRPDHK